MPELGGPTTQSGIYYQNSVAALYLGALLDLRAPVGSQRVTSVRVEAPTHIDDIVVKYADQSLRYIQAKESLTVGSEPWKKFWLALSEQYATSIGKSEFRLVISNVSEKLLLLQEAIDRARGKNDFAEWRKSLSVEQREVAEKAYANIPGGENKILEIFKNTIVEFMPLSSVETFGVRDWIPSSSVAQNALFSYLRDLCGGGARHRVTFNSIELSEKLLRQFNVRVYGAPGDNIEQYRTAVLNEFKYISVPGTHVFLESSKAFVRVEVSATPSYIRADFEDEDPFIAQRYEGESVDLMNFPQLTAKCVVLESGAGYGKTTALKTIARRLANSTAYIPVYINASSLDGFKAISDYLNSEYNTKYSVSINWTGLCEQGRLAIIIDGIDELNDLGRISVVSAISALVSRYENTPILVGARDASLGGFQPPFEFYRLHKLDEEQSREMLSAYLKARPDLSARKVIRHFFDYPDLNALCRIPLFLAIYVVTLPKSGKIPTSRTELLENYLMRALSPQKFKSSVYSRCLQKATLRQSAEVIAQLGMGKNEFALVESQVLSHVSTRFPEINSDECIDTLIQYGILERRGTRLVFPIPTVQEYLAACVVSLSIEAWSPENFTDDWIKQVYRRPWAQTLQFAIEKLEDASSIINIFLSQEDDVFYTCFRFATRCVVNGARISTELRVRIGEKLFKIWTKNDYLIGRKISNLIVDGGFYRELPAFARTHLLEPTPFVDGRAAIVAKMGDVDTVKHCLDVVLACDDIRELWNAEWVEALKLIPEYAINRLLLRAQSEITDEFSVGVISEVIYRLRKQAEIDWKSICQNDNLPILLRVAAHFGDGGAPSEELLKTVLQSGVDFGGWTSFVSAFRELPIWKDCLRAMSVSPASWKRCLACFGGSADFSDDMAEFSEELVAASETVSELRFILKLALGGFGNELFALQATDLLKDLPYAQCSSWIGELPYLSQAARIVGVNLLRRREFSVDQQIELIESISSSLMSKPKGRKRTFLSRGPFVRAKSDCQVSNLVANWIEELSHSPELTEEKRRTLYIAAARSGGRKSEIALIDQLKHYLQTHDQVAEEDWGWLFTTIYTLHDNELLNVELLWDAVEKAAGHPLSFFTEAIIQREGSKCYPRLVEYFEKGASGSAKQGILSYFERNAEHLGVIVSHKGNILSIKNI